MQVELHDQFQNPQRLKASRVVVYDDFGNPIGLFLQTARDHVVVSVADSEDFNRVLRQLGIDKTLVISTVRGTGMSMP